MLDYIEELIEQYYKVRAVPLDLLVKDVVYTYVSFNSSVDKRVYKTKVKPDATMLIKLPTLPTLGIFKVLERPTDSFTASIGAYGENWVLVVDD